DALDGGNRNRANGRQNRDGDAQIDRQIMTILVGPIDPMPVAVTYPRRLRIALARPSVPPAQEDCRRAQIYPASLASGSAPSIHGGPASLLDLDPAVAVLGAAPVHPGVDRGLGSARFSLGSAQLPNSPLDKYQERRATRAAAGASARPQPWQARPSAHRPNRSDIADQPGS